MTIKIRRGLDIRVSGVPDQSVEAGPPIHRVALLGRDYVGVKPGLLVEPGETVGLGQPVFTDKSNPEVLFCAPAGGLITAINRGRRRSLTSLVCDVTAEPGPEKIFATYTKAELSRLDHRVVCDQLLSSGLWTAFRTRPFSRIPRARSKPQAIFVTAMDTRPLAADPAVVIQSKVAAFTNGVAVVERLTDGPVYVCMHADAPIDLVESEQIRCSRFTGPHPAGLPGTHIHFLHPVSDDRLVWHIGYQDVIALGQLFTTGRLDTRRVIALGGPAAERPRLMTTRLGASIDDLLQQQRLSYRAVSGSIVGGHTAYGDAAFLGRYHNQVTLLPERRERRLFGWLRKSAMTTSQHGEPAAMVPLEAFERVVPLDLLAASLLRTLLVKDTVGAQRLGCLELDEEDLALCSYVCPAKIDYGAALRANLQQIWREG